MREAILAAMLVCLCASGWVMYYREAKVSGAFRQEIMDYSVVVPYGLIDQVTLLMTTHRHGVKVPGSPSLRPFNSAWNELHGLVLSAMLGVTGPQEFTSTGWTRVAGLPADLTDIIQNRPLVRLEETSRRWVYFTLEEPVSLGSIEVSRFMLFTEIGWRVSELYVEDGKGAWLHATTLVSANLVDAYIRDATEPDPD